VGAGEAADEAIVFVADAAQRDALRALRDEFEHLVLAGVPDTVLNGPRDPSLRLWNTSNIGFPQLEAEALLLLLSERGVCASAGAACSSGSLEPSPVLLAMGIEPRIAHGSLRFSLSKYTTREQVHEAARVITESVARLRQSMP
jgi:cysteine desulfurase